MADYFYNAFISYSHGADREFAPSLHRALHRLACPWYRIRTLRVFRDQEDLTANPNLWKVIESALRKSEYLIYLASPTAANSPWVEKELRVFSKVRGVGSIVIVLTEGTISWKDGDFDWSQTDALPPSIFSEQFTSEPLWVDFREFKEREYNLRDPDFANAVATIAAPLHHLENKAQLVNEDIRQNRRRVRLFSGLAIMVSLFALTATGLGLFARQQQTESELRSSTNLLEQALGDCTVGNINECLHRMVDASKTLPNLLRGEEAFFNALFGWPDKGSSLLSREVLEDSINRGLSSWGSDVGDVFYHGGSGSGVEMIWTDYETQMIVDNGSDEVVLWDLQTGLPIVRFPYKGISFSVQVNHKLGRLLIAHDDMLSIWSLRTFEKLRKIKHPGSVTKLAIHPTQPLVATASSTDTTDYAIRLIDAKSFIVIKEFRVKKNVRTLRFSQEGTYLVAAGEFRDTRLVDIKPGYPVRELPAKQGSIEAAFSPTERYLLTAHFSNDYSVRVWETITGKRLKTIPHGDLVRKVQFHPSGKFFVTSGNDKVVRVFTADTLEERYKFSHSGYATSLQFIGLDEQWLLTKTDDSQVSLWDLQTGNIIGKVTQIKSSCPPRILTWSAHPLLVVCQGNVVEVYSVLTGKPFSKSIIHQRAARVVDVRVSNKKMHVWTFADDRTFRRTDLSTSIPQYVVPISAEVREIDYSPNMDVLAVSTHVEGIRVINREGEMRASISPSSVGNRFSEAYFSEDGSVLIFGRETGEIYRWHWQTDEPPISTATYSDRNPPPEVYPVGNDGGFFVVGHHQDDKDNQRYELVVFAPSGRVIAGPFQNKTISAKRPIVDKNGTRLIAGSGYFVRIWELNPSPGKLVFEYEFDKGIVDMARAESEPYLALARGGPQ